MLLDLPYPLDILLGLTIPLFFGAMAWHFPRDLYRLSYGLEDTLNDNLLRRQSDYNRFICVSLAKGKILCLFLGSHPTRVMRLEVILCRIELFNLLFSS